MMIPIQPGEIAFSTQNAGLAFCLYMSGVPFQNERVPCIPEYDQEIIDGFKDSDGRKTYEGLKLIDAIRQAHADGKKGRVTYFLKRPNEIDSLCRAYAEQEKELKEGTGTAQALELSILKQYKDGEMTEHMALVRLNCVTMKMRPEFMGMWKKITPHIRIPNKGKSVSREFSTIKDGKRIQGTVTKQPGFRSLSINASDEIKKHLKV